MTLSFYWIDDQELVAVQSPAKTLFISSRLAFIVVKMGQITWVDRESITDTADLKEDGWFGIQ